MSKKITAKASGHGWVPVTPRGRALWHCADETKSDAEHKARRYGVTDSYSQHAPSWYALRADGWRVVKCYTGVDLAK